MKKEDMTNDANFHAFISYQKTKKTEEIYLKSFEISEEDLRVKSASFETTKKIDTSKEMTWLYVTFLGQIVYAGNILSSEYDETTGYYKYSTIGHQRWLSSKTWYVANAEAKTEDLYSILKEFLDKTVAETTVAGYVLQPKKKYQSYQSTTNNWELTDGLFYEDKTYYEILMSLIAKTNCAIDFYVDENNLVHADPLDVKAWQSNKSILFTTDKLKEYTIKQDSTNIITSVLVKTTDIYKNNKITEPNVYKGSDLIGIDLTMYYGNLSAFTQFDTTKANTNKIKKGLKDVDSNEALARNQITTSMRDLMSFEIVFDGFIPQLHTNMFLYFEVPQKHSLANYSRFVANIDKTTTRGGTYVLNRFYVEKVSTSYGEDGVETKVTLNPFASDLSSYSNAYDEAKNSYDKANCDTSKTSEESSDTGQGEEDGSATTQTITVTGKPSTAQAMKYYDYKPYTKTWKNYCPFCKKTGTLTDNPKKVAEHEITCYKKKGGCDADFDVTTGGDKSGSYRKYLIDANGKSNTKKSVDTNIGGTIANNQSNASTSLTSDSGDSCTSLNSDKEGNFQSQLVEMLANKITKATEQVQIMKDLQQMKTKGYVGYHCHSGFCWDAETVVKKGQANCCDGTRLELTMAFGKGIPASDLTYVHGHGHVWGRYKGGNVDWLGGANWFGRAWGGNSVSKTSAFPRLPFSNSCINPYSHCGADETIEESVGSAKQYAKKFDDFLEDEIKDLMIMDFEDMEYYIEKQGGDGNLHGFGNLR